MNGLSAARNQTLNCKTQLEINNKFNNWKNYWKLFIECKSLN